VAPLFGLFALFPCTFYLANFGAGAPTIVAIHLDQPSPLLVTLATLFSIAAAGLLIWSASCLLPAEAAKARVGHATGARSPGAAVTAV